MNYFTHGRTFVDQPYVLAGTAVPDWLNVVDRRVRVRSRQAETFVHDSDPNIAALARGIVQHHRDDAWFHKTRAFAELSLGLAKSARRVLPGDDGMRPSFLGHILVEVLLDAALIEAQPARLDDYYRAAGTVKPAVVAEGVQLMSARRVDSLAEFVSFFVTERFLYDYADDAKLLFRLNQVMARVGLPELPDSFGEVLLDARPRVAARQHELLEPASE